MAAVLWEIIIPLLVAFGVGLLIGWLLWRWRRSRVTTTEWEGLRSSADSAEQRAATLSSERDGLSKRVAALSADLSASEDAAGAIRGELETKEGRLGILSTEHAGSTAKVNELEKKLAEAAKRAKDLEDGQKEARARTAERDGEMNEMRARAQRSGADLDGMKARLGERDAELKKALDGAAQAESKIAAGSKELQDAKAMVGQLEAGDASATSKLERLTAQLGERDSELKKARDSAAQGEARIANLAKAEAEAESARAMAKTLDRELGDARRGASSIEGDLLSARARIEELEVLVASPSAGSGAMGFVGTASVDAPTLVAPGAADDGEPDNLQLIDGVGPKLEQFLHRQGITTFAQLAALKKGEIDALQGKLPEFPGRIKREEWVPQAKGIVSGKTSIRVVPKSERDDLKRIKGVGPVLERWLHGSGIYRFVDLVELDPSAVTTLSSKLEDFPGRIEREEWVKQAGQLARETAAAR